MLGAMDFVPEAKAVRREYLLRCDDSKLLDRLQKDFVLGRMRALSLERQKRDKLHENL